MSHIRFISDLKGLCNDVVDKIGFDFLDHVFEPEFLFLELLHVEKVYRLVAFQHALDHFIKCFVLGAIFGELHLEFFLVLHMRKVVQKLKP